MKYGKIMLLLIIAIHIYNNNSIEEILSEHLVNRVGPLCAGLVAEGRSKLLRARSISRKPIIISLYETIML